MTTTGSQPRFLVMAALSQVCWCADVRWRLRRLTAGAIKLIRFLVLINAMIPRTAGVSLSPGVMQVRSAASGRAAGGIQYRRFFCHLLYADLRGGATAIMCFYAPDITTA
jgi:hypothetical protein